MATKAKGKGGGKKAKAKKAAALYKVFVYGTLRAGMRNHHWLRGSSLVAATKTRRDHFVMLDISGSFPGVIYARGNGDGATEIIGEVYAVTAEVLAELDRHEGCPRHYKRELIETRDCGRCFTYIYQMPNPARVYPSDIVRGGDWVEWVGVQNDLPSIVKHAQFMRGELETA